jgi:hypothetical protein
MRAIEQIQADIEKAKKQAGIPGISEEQLNFVNNKLDKLYIELEQSEKEPEPEPKPKPIPKKKKEKNVVPEEEWDSDEILSKAKERGKKRKKAKKWFSE